MQTEQERKEKRKERNQKYWNEHKKEIAIKRKRKRMLLKQAEKFANDIQNDESLQRLLVELTEDENVNKETIIKDSLMEYARKKKHVER